MAKKRMIDDTALVAFDKVLQGFMSSYEDIRELSKRMRLMTVGISMSANFGEVAALVEHFEMPNELTDEEFIKRMSDAVASRDIRTALHFYKNIVEDLDSDIAAKKKTISKLEERVALTEDKSSPEFKVVAKKLDATKNNLLIREGRMNIVLTEFFKVRHSAIKSVVAATEDVVDALITGNKHTEELALKYSVSSMLKKIEKMDRVFTNGKEC